MGSVRNGRPLILILVVAGLLRLSAAIAMGDRITVLPGIYDQVSYDALAQNLLAGQGYSFDEKWYPFTPANTPTAHWSFIYPLYLAGVYALTGYHPLVARLLQSVVGGVLICFLVYLIGRRLVDEITGLVAAGLAAVYGYFVYYSAALMTETFSILLVLASLYLGLQSRDRPTLSRWILLGLTLGLGALLRQTILIFMPFLLLWLFIELRRGASRWWHFAVPLVVVGLLIAPWTIRNYAVFDTFLPLNSNAGYAFFASSNPNLGTDWNNDKVVVPIPAELNGRNEAELDRALTRLAISQILASPQRYAWLTLNKSLEFFKFWPSSDSGTISNLNRMLSFGLYLPLMLWGLWRSLAHRRRFLPLYLFAAVHTGLHLLTWPSPRYRLPIDAVLMVMAALAVIELTKQITARRRGLPLVYRLASDSGD